MRMHKTLQLITYCVLIACMSAKAAAASSTVPVDHVANTCLGFTFSSTNLALDLLFPPVKNTLMEQAEEPKQSARIHALSQDGSGPSESTRNASAQWKAAFASINFVPSASADVLVVPTTEASNVTSSFSDSRGALFQNVYPAWLWLFGSVIVGLLTISRRHHSPEMSP